MPACRYTCTCTSIHRYIVLYMQFMQRKFFVEKGPASNGLHRAPQWLEPALPPCEGCVASVAAVVYCNQCCEFLCTTCGDYRKISRKTKDHKLVDGKCSINTPLPSTPSKPLYCSVPQHSDEKLKFYCEDCKVLVCSDCILCGNHKNHSYCDCDKVVETCHSDLHASIQGCTEVVTTLGDAISNGERMIQQIQGCQQEVNQKINSTFDALQVALADRCKALLKESHNITIGKVTAINIQLETYHKLKDQVSFASKYVTDILQSQQSTELLSTKKTIEDRLKKLKSDFESLSCDLMEDDTIIASLDCTEFERGMSEFGAVNDIDVCPSLCEIESGIGVPLVEYELSVKVRGAHVKNSPYRIWVKAKQRFV